MILNGIEANATAYNAIIDMFSKMRVVFEARHWFNRMINSKVLANTSTFNILIDMYGKLEKPVEAMETYKLMIKSNVKPCVITFTSMIDMWGKLQQPDEVEKLYQAMLDWGIKPNQNTHVVMLRGAKWNTIVHHNKILEEKHWLSCISMSVFIDSCGYNNRLDVAIEFWKKISRAHTNLITANVYTSMIEACGRCNDLLKGKEILELFEASDLFLSSTVEEKTKLYQTYETQIVAKENNVAQPANPYLEGAQANEVKPGE
jgi:pentatricopeptide repeat domain-containing protein 1